MLTQTTPFHTGPINRRSFLQSTAIAGVTPLLTATNGTGTPLAPVAAIALQTSAATGAHVGSLFPFAQSQAKGEFPACADFGAVPWAAWWWRC